MRLVASLHDVHPGSFAAVRAQAGFLSARGVDRFTLLVVPDYHGRGRFDADAGLVGWLRERQAAGDDIVLHGFRHWIGPEDAGRGLGAWYWRRVYTANEAEFLRLPLARARELLARGREMLEGAGLRTAGFIAPAWLLGEEARAAVWALEFGYTTTISRVLYRDGREVRARSLCWSSRAAWRRLGSRVWNGALWRRLRRAGSPVARLALHPRDLEHPAMRSQIGRIVEEATGGGWRGAVYSELAGGG